MPSFSIFLGLVVSFLGFSAVGGECRRGDTGEILSVEALVREISPGATVFLGELHGFAEVAAGQVEILKELRNQGHAVDVAFEFFPYTQQTLVDQSARAEINEAEFLRAIGWGKSMDFSSYREQALFPRWQEGERVWAINAPRSLTGAIAKRGLAQLTEEEKSLLPPDIKMGRESYKDRFREQMGGHVKEEALQRYFEAQSVWDETMAWKLAMLSTRNTKVVVVGEFHVQYGGGLPFQLSLRVPEAPLKSVGFINIQGLSDAEIQDLLRPSERWGVREDFICAVVLPEGLNRPKGQ